MDELRGSTSSAGRICRPAIGTPAEQLLTLSDLIGIALAARAPARPRHRAEAALPVRSRARASRSGHPRPHPAGTAHRRPRPAHGLADELRSRIRGPAPDEVDPSLVMLLTGRWTPPKSPPSSHADPDPQRVRGGTRRERLAVALTAAIDLIDDGQVQGGPDIEWVRGEQERVRGWIERGLDRARLDGRHPPRPPVLPGARRLRR